MNWFQVEERDVPDGLKLEIKSDCGKNTDLVSTKSCSDVEIGTAVTFNVEVRASKCLDPGQSQFSIFPVGINQSLIVEVETLCRCGCEIPG